MLRAHLPHWEGLIHVVERARRIFNLDAAQLDATTHLPLRRTFKYRNETFKDYDEDAETYDDYHTVQGIPTSFTITRYHDGDMSNQRFLTKVGRLMNGLGEAGGEFLSTPRVAERPLLRFSRFKGKSLKVCRH